MRPIPARPQPIAAPQRGLPAGVAAAMPPPLQRPDEIPEPGWWTESADGRCSQQAALFAASQPAPLTVV